MLLPPGLHLDSGFRSQGVGDERRVGVDAVSHIHRVRGSYSVVGTGLSLATHPQVLLVSPLFRWGN